MMRGSAVPTTVWSSASNKRVSIKAPSTLKRANPRRRRPLSGPACCCDTDDLSIAFSSIDFFSSAEPSLFMIECRERFSARLRRLPCTALRTGSAQHDHAYHRQQQRQPPDHSYQSTNIPASDNPPPL